LQVQEDDRSAQEIRLQPAADEIKDSKWYSQVKLRGIEDVELMRAVAG
jgi:hypothetical protein